MGGVLGAFKSNRYFYGTCDCIAGLPDSCQLAYGGYANGQLTFRMRNIGCGRTPLLDIYVDVQVKISISRFAVNYGDKFQLVKGQQVGSQWNC